MSFFAQHFPTLIAKLGFFASSVSAITALRDFGSNQLTIELDATATQMVWVTLIANAELPEELFLPRWLFHPPTFGLLSFPFLVGMRAEHDPRTFVLIGSEIIIGTFELERAWEITATTIIVAVRKMTERKLAWGTQIDDKPRTGLALGPLRRVLTAMFVLT